MAKKFSLRYFPLFAILLIIIGISLMFPNFINNIFYNLWVGEQTISGPVELGPTWLELTPAPPLKAARNLQYVSLGVSEAPKWELSGSGALVNPRGENVKIEIQIIDDQGAVYDLNSIAIGKTLLFTRNPGEQGGSRFSSFPHERRYMMVKIRSDKPIRVDGIQWITEYSK